MKRAVFRVRVTLPHSEVNVFKPSMEAAEVFDVVVSVTVQVLLVVDF